MKEGKRHIDQVLKEKLGDHSLPVSEQEWTEFNTLFQKHKRKRKGMLWFVSLVLLSLIGTGICFLIPEKAPLSNVENTQDKKENKSTTKDNGSKGPVDLSERVSGLDNKTVDPQEGNSQSNGLSGNDGVTQRGIAEAPRQSTPKQQAPAEEMQKTPSEKIEAGKTGNESTNGNTGSSPEPLVNRRPDLNTPSIEGLVMRFMVPPIRWQPSNRIPSAPPSVFNGQKNDSSKNQSRKKVEQRKLGPSIAFGMVYGFGTPTLSVPAYDTTEIHKNYEQVLENTPRESEVFRLYAKYEYKLNLAFDITAGLEFSSNVQKQQFDFEQRSIPFLDADDRILDYIELPNSTPVAPTRFESKQVTYSARVPVSFGYSRFVTANLRFGARVQATFGFNWSNSSYLGLTPVTLSEEKMTSRTNPFSLGYGGGLFAEYFYLEKWSLRGSFDYTGQNGQYRKNSSYNLNNRFYEFNLAIVRYL